MGLIFGRNWMKSSNKEPGCLDFRPRNRYFGCKMNTDVNNGGVAGNKRVGDRVSDQFPAGLRVLAVDDDPLCLKVLEKMLMNCLYEVTTCSRAVIALRMLRERRDGFDIVLSDVYMPDMDGFKLLEHIGLEMDLPVIMMSADDGKDVVMKGVTHGACDYLIKPVRIEALKNIWQHVIRKKKTDLKDLDQSESLEDSDRHKKVSDDPDYASSVNEGNWKNSKRRKDMKGEEDEAEEHEDSSTLKKPRVVWSVGLHQQFVAAVNQLGIDKAVPKKILELMSVPGLTRENVASHLQKYRLYLKRLSRVSQHQGGLNRSSFLCPPDANFNSIASFEGFDLHAQNIATLQGVGRQTVTTGMGMPLVDQINFFRYEPPTASSSKMRYEPTQQLSNKQMSLLPGLPTTIEPKQFAHLHPSLQSFGSKGLQASEGASGGFLSLPTQQVGSSSNMGHIHGPESGSLMMQMTYHRKQLPVFENLNQIQVDMPRQPSSSGQLLNEISGGHGLPRSNGQFLNEIAAGHASGLPSSMGQQILSDGIAGHVLGKTGPAMKGRSPSSGGACATNSSSNVSVSQAAPVGFQLNQCSEFPGNGFPITSTTGAFQKVVPITEGLEGPENGTHLKGIRPLISGNDMFGEFCQNKNHDWELQNINSVYDTNQSMIFLMSNPDFELGHQGFTGSQKIELSRNELGSQVAIAQCQNSLLSDNSFRMKVDANAKLSSENMLLKEHFLQDDIMKPLFKQVKQTVALLLLCIVLILFLLFWSFCLCG